MKMDKLAIVTAGIVAWLGVLAQDVPVTAGWEDVPSGRREVSPVKVLWRADFSDAQGFTWEFLDGAKGTVEVREDGIHVVKTNGEGYIVISARAFPVKKNLEVRFAADETVKDADVDYSSGFLRGWGRVRNLRLDKRCDSAYGGLQPMRALPCTAPGTRYRKYAQTRAKDGVLTPAIVIGGAPSESVWHDWLAEDAVAANRAFVKDVKTRHKQRNHLAEAEDEASFDRRLASDGEHTAQIESRDGFSRLVVDGRVEAPAVFHGHHPHKGQIDDGFCSFAGKRYDGSAIRLMVVSTRTAQFYREDGHWDVRAVADELKRQMRIAPNSLFIIGIQVNAPSGFVEKQHPEEAWIDERGNRVRGVGSCCILGMHAATAEDFAKKSAVWPSPSSPVWRSLINSQIEALVGELHRRNLAKRIVGVHLYGYHDGQMSVCYIDHSKRAQEEYLREIARPDCLSTNYSYCMRGAAQRALNEFARTFKRAMGKPVIAIKWCESPWQFGKRDADTSITDFTRCDALDVLVCQPDYRERFPGFPGTSTPPVDSLHLHRKMFWNELDLRTFVARQEEAKQAVQSPPRSKLYGYAEDMAMWRTIYRKYAGEADATRMGYWLFDLKGGWYDHPDLAADIRSLVEEEADLARQKPSDWRPNVAMVVDETQMLCGDKPLCNLSSGDNWLYAWNCRYFGSSGVPYRRYLAEDALARPDLLKDVKLVVLSGFRAIDARRKDFLERLVRQGTAVVFLSGTGVRGGSEVTGFAPYRAKNASHRVVPEPGVAENVMSPISVSTFRNQGDADFNAGARMTLRERPDIRILARYACDGLPALAERRDSGVLRAYVCEPGGLTPALLNRFAREAGAYVALDRPGLQLDMNGDFASVHCLRPGTYSFRMPYPCRVRNLKTGLPEEVSDGVVTLRLTAGETCRFRLFPAAR